MSRCIYVWLSTFNLFPWTKQFPFYSTCCTGQNKGDVSKHTRSGVSFNVWTSISLAMCPVVGLLGHRVGLCLFAECLHFLTFCVV